MAETRNSCTACEQRYEQLDTLKLSIQDRAAAIRWEVQLQERLAHATDALRCVPRESLLPQAQANAGAADASTAGSSVHQQIALQVARQKQLKQLLLEKQGRAPEDCDLTTIQGFQAFLQQQMLRIQQEIDSARLVVQQQTQEIAEETTINNIARQVCRDDNVEIEAIMQQQRQLAQQISEQQNEIEKVYDDRSALAEKLAQAEKLKQQLAAENRQKEQKLAALMDSGAQTAAAIQTQKGQIAARLAELEQIMANE